MRVAFDIASLAVRSGAQRQVLEVASGLVERGHDVVVIVNKTAEQYPEYRRRVRIRELRRMGRADVRVVADIWRALRDVRPDVCICVSFNATLWGRLAAAVLGCRVMVAEHATRDLSRRSIRLSNRLLGPVTECVIACAEAQRDALVRALHPARKITVVPNGVDVERFRRDEAGGAALREEYGIPPRAAVVGLVGAHRPEKRHDRFIALVEDLNDRGIDAWGLMVGDGPLLERTTAMAARSRAAGRLVLTGARDDITAVYSALDVAVLTSDSESFPLCFLEAQACGVPVVGLDVGGVRETMLEGETGLLVDGAAPGALGDAVAHLLAQGGLAAKMGEAGRAFVARELSREAMIDGYCRVLAGAPSRAMGPAGRA